MRSLQIAFVSAVLLFAAAPAVAGSRLGPASDATLLDSAGQPTQLANTFASGSTIVVFYKGHF